MPSQAQKHVTHNEAIGMLDALVQMAIVRRDLAAPPSLPADGARYIVAAGASGAWSGHDAAIAHWLDGGWSSIAPRTGFLCHVAEENRFVFWSGSAWADLAEVVIGALQNLELIGIGTEADAANPFAAKVNKALWTAKAVAEGGDGDLRYTLNKEAAADTLSLLMQTGYSGRAELGLAGSDDFTIKVSPDGAGWTSALTINRATGLASVAADPVDPLGIATRQYALPRSGGTMTGDLSITAPPPPNSKVVAESSYAQATLESFRTSTATHCNFVGTPRMVPPRQPGLCRRGQCQSLRTVVAALERHGVRPASAAWLRFVGSALGHCTWYRVRHQLHAHRQHGSPGCAPRFGVGGPFDVRLEPVIDENRHVQLRSYTFATLPAVLAGGQMIYCSDLGGGGGQLVSDGTRWIRVMLATKRWAAMPTLH